MYQWAFYVRITEFDDMACYQVVPRHDHPKGLRAERVLDVEAGRREAVDHTYLHKILPLLDQQAVTEPKH